LQARDLLSKDKVGPVRLVLLSYPKEIKVVRTHCHFPYFSKKMIQMLAEEKVYTMPELILAACVTRLSDK
jgi:hypothetical protein